MEVNIYIPKLHENQKNIVKGINRFNVIRCGRRFGKNILAKWRLGKLWQNSECLSFIALDYTKQLKPFWEECKEMFHPIIKRRDEQGHTLKLINDCTIGFWSKETIESMRGWKNNHIFFDEAAMDQKLEEHFNYVILPTLMDFGGGGDFFSTPKGHNYFKTIDEKSKTNPLWSSFHYTSYDNPHIDNNEIDILRDEMTSIVAQQEIYAQYVDQQGALIKREWVKYKEPPNDLNLYMGVDLAISQKETADYTAIAVVGKDKDGKIYVVDIHRARKTFNEAKDMIINIANKWHIERMGIESVAYQAAIVQELNRTTNLNIKSIKPDKDKVTRFQPLAARYEQGLVYHNTDLMNEFENELLSFTGTKTDVHDDMVDALAYAYQMTNKKVMQVY